MKPQTIALTSDLLLWLGLTWDGEAVLQSTRREAHAAAMQVLAKKGLTYPSAKLRSEGSIPDGNNAQSAPQEGSHEVRFGAEQRPATLPKFFSDDSPTWRFATPDRVVALKDLVAGDVRVHPFATVGDFVVWSKRENTQLGQAAYQLAVVVDDAAAGVTHVIRGNDLLDSAGRQMLIMDALGMTPPTYAHVPLVRGADGKRLAKRHGDTRLDVYRAKGVKVERVIGLMAAWCGVLPREAPREMELAEFIERFSLATLSREDVVYGAADEAWLMG